MAGQIAALVAQIRVHEADNGRPAGNDYPEVVAAVEATFLDWNEAIRQILAKHQGRPVRAETVLKEMQVSKPVRCNPDEPVDLTRVRVRLSQGAQRGFWDSVGSGPGNVGYAPKPDRPREAGCGRRGRGSMTTPAHIPAALHWCVTCGKAQDERHWHKPGCEYVTFIRGAKARRLSKKGAKS